MVKTSDVVVIGGGAVGTSVAYYIAQKGLDVVLVEKGGIAAGTSGRCDGNVMLNDTIPGYDCQLKKMSQDLFPVLAQNLDFNIFWRQKGSVLVIESENDMVYARKYCQKMQAQGLPAKILDRNEMLDEAPHLSKDIAGGMEMACDGSINPMALSQGLAHKAKKLGAKILTHTIVESIGLNRQGGIERVVTGSGKILTKNIINAAGIWAREIGHLVGLNIPVQPRKGQILVGERTFNLGRRKLQEFGYNRVKFEKNDSQQNSESDKEKHGVAFVFEPTESGNFLIGSSRWFTDTTNTSVEVLRCIAQRAIRFLPILKDVRFIRSYAGLRPYSPDHYPIVSSTPIPGFYVAAGHEGNGIGLAPITGRLIAQMLCGEKTDISIEPLSFHRFIKKQRSDERKD